MDLVSTAQQHHRDPNGGEAESRVQVLGCEATDPKAHKANAPGQLSNSSFPPCLCEHNPGLGHGRVDLSIRYPCFGERFPDALDVNIVIALSDHKCNRVCADPGTAVCCLLLSGGPHSGTVRPAGPAISASAGRAVGFHQATSYGCFPDSRGPLTSFLRALYKGRSLGRPAGTGLHTRPAAKMIAHPRDWQRGAMPLSPLYRSPLQSPSAMNCQRLFILWPSLSVCEGFSECPQAYNRLSCHFHFSQRKLRLS